ncbi:unnamed protein product [Dovyalis caffra]|uniref:Uncharacterized protein n=1 Tax=Dovyalis caffra TaxID=77055 RepID=A0AAV1SH64_9ROSI|nr:unnamed protein product [Dovyalis caffra]
MTVQVWLELLSTHCTNFREANAGGESSKERYRNPQITAWLASQVDDKGTALGNIVLPCNGAIGLSQPCFLLSTAACAGDFPSSFLSREFPEGLTSFNMMDDGFPDETHPSFSDNSSYLSSAAYLYNSSSIILSDSSSALQADAEVQGLAIMEPKEANRHLLSEPSSLGRKGNAGANDPGGTLASEKDNADTETKNGSDNSNVVDDETNQSHGTNGGQSSTIAHHHYPGRHYYPDGA